MPNKLEWLAQYSVGVAEIDAQHQILFTTINELIDVLSAVPEEERLNKIIGELLEYKKIHFATEEKYFHQFNFEGTEEHEAQHRSFGDQLTKLTEEKNDITTFAFKLVDFLEDWLVTHLMTMDQKYVQCFKEHGLK